MKNDTVIGTMGNTQGVKSESAPIAMASHTNPRSVPPPAEAAAMSVTRGEGADGSVSSVPDGSLEMVFAPAVPRPTTASNDSSSSLGGRHNLSLQVWYETVIASRWAPSLADDAT